MVAADPNAASPGGGRKRGFFQWALAGVILLAEYLLVSLFFDARTVAERGGVWAFAGSLGTIAPLAVVSATALVQFVVLAGGKPGEYGRFAVLPCIVLGLACCIWIGRAV